jgi:hypothetical protein
MRSIITILPLIILGIISTFSENITGAWHGTAKTPDNKQILFVFLFEKNEEVYNTTMEIPAFDVSDTKLKSTSVKKGILHIDSSNVEIKYKGKLNLLLLKTVYI